MNLTVLKKLESKKFITSSVIIFFISIIYSLLHGSGFYGYGTDYHWGYSNGFEFFRANAPVRDYMGFWISTIIINEIHIGVYIVAFIVTFGTGLFIRDQIKFKQSYSLIFFLLLFLIVIHTWPIIMSPSNAMRQAMSMSFIFLVFTYSFHKNYFYIILFSFLAIFMHKSGIFFITIFVIAFTLNKLLKNFSDKNKVIINLLIGISSLITFNYVLNNFSNNQPSRVIAGDFRLAFIIMAISYIMMSFYFKNFLTNSVNLSLYYFSFLSLPVVMNGFNWEYERLGMMMLIPYIFSFGSLINIRSYKFYLLSSFILLLILTFHKGIYGYGLLNTTEFFLKRF